MASNYDVDSPPVLVSEMFKDTIRAMRIQRISEKGQQYKQ